MSTENKTEYLLLFRRTNWDQGLSAEQLQAAMDRFMGWFERLKNAGTVKAGQPLATEGKVISGKNGRTVADGPFAESKEAVGGYFILLADSLDEATAIAKESPILEYGGIVEVRPIADECPTFRRVKEKLAAAIA
jgi:hypothetical protein